MRWLLAKLEIFWHTGDMHQTKFHDIDIWQRKAYMHQPQGLDAGQKTLYGPVQPNGYLCFAVV
ncbi:MAG TPA: hypothetical protein DCS30_14685 [Rhizobiales bacterium]|nr:hypothetical protein [Hyphomicrobiales bacterium]